jgi:uncharacterized membrane protein
MATRGKARRHRPDHSVQLYVNNNNHSLWPDETAQSDAAAPVGDGNGGAQRKIMTGPPSVGSAERIASLISGGALALFGLSRRSPWGLIPLAAGGYLLFRGVTAHDPVYEGLGVKPAEDGAGTRDTAGSSNNPLTRQIHVEKTITVDRPVGELYAFWRNFENLPRFMQHLNAVTVQDDRHSHWVAKAPLGQEVAWDAEITDEQENAVIAWQALPGSEIYNAGRVEFRPAPADRGTEIKVSFDYAPPGGVMGALVAKVFGEEPLQQVQDDLRHFKAMMETGEVPTTEGQPSGRDKQAP